ncbi:DHA2 family lincomycin resistance protein-like MFS transporter [Kineococcus radiotolerans]|uniref:DHA2 family lincomycin resistance protein-like MFS transporter n=1 Tax=Kineococcus radiotolerans TaxID=131568 RepID=A0A7W4XYR0_KINRA|nr:MDR family MFS transporter [Kineococcus radiotolerans]MBB2903406.1 DHA2 family lincomycin resistance protein-like MFS transporter [Kineococcus radiotolerans]
MNPHHDAASSQPPSSAAALIPQTGASQSPRAAADGTGGAEPVATVDSKAHELPAGAAGLIGLLLVSAFVVILNETVMGVALSRLMDDLGVSAATGQWLTTGYLLTMAIVIPATGFLMQRFTIRQLFISAMSLFTLGTAIAAIAPGFEVLLLGRVVQAGGTAIIMPLVMTTVMNLIPASRRGQVMGTMGIVISVAPAVGPTLSGVILASLSWRWIFIVMLPIAALALLLGLWKVRNLTQTRPAHLDAASLLLAAVGFGGLIYGLSLLGEGAGHAPLAPWIPLVVGVSGIAVFVERQNRLLRGRGPLMDVRVVKERSFAISLGVLIIGFMALFGGLIVLPLFLQNVLGFTTLKTGLLMLPGGLTMGLMSPIAGRLFDRVGPRPLVTPGAIALSGGLWILSTLHPGSSVALIVVAHCVLMMGLAFMITPLMTTGLGSLKPELYPHGSAILNTLQQVAGAAGTALFISILSTTTSSHIARGVDAATANAEGVQQAFMWGGVISIVAVLASLLVRRPATIPTQRVPLH